MSVNGLGHVSFEEADELDANVEDEPLTNIEDIEVEIRPLRPNDATDLSEAFASVSVQTPDHVSMHVMRQLLQGETGGKLELHHLTGAAEILGSVVCAVQSQNLKTK